MTEKPQHIGQLIKMIDDITEKKANQNLKDSDVTFGQMKMLITLEQSADHSCTLKELERLFGSTQATIAGTAARLEKKGLAEGYIDPDDRRIKHIRITEKGLALCVSTKASIDDSEQCLVHTLTPDEEEELMRLLIQVYEGMETYYPDLKESRKA